VLGERRVPALLKNLQHGLLDQSVDDARHAELSDPAVRFGRSCSPSTTGSPRASTRPISKRQRPFSILSNSEGRGVRFRREAVSLPVAA
jgi:hypothetical protein